MHIRFRAARVAALGLALGLVLAACGGNADGGGDGGDSAASPAGESTRLHTGFVRVQQAAGEPVDGGTLEIATPIQAYSLDPAELAGVGVLGGLEMAAIYDVLVRYNPKTGEYEPQLAKGLEHNADFTRWTLTLREGVQFSDGTPFNAAAVKFSINRYVEKQGYLASLITRVLDKMTTPNPRTVVFHLKRAWSAFPYLLANTPGMIVSPTAAKKWGDDFTIHPVGAGAFVLERYATDEEIVLTANPNYWGGRPHLDRLRFVPISKSHALLQTLNSGGVDLAVISDPEVVAAALDQGYSGYMRIAGVKDILVINNAPGRPGSDLRVRKAIAYAVNPEVLYQRAFGGAGLPGKELFPKPSRWHNEGKTTPYNPEKARKLLAQAKQDGYDGKIEVMYTQQDEDQALTIKAMLESVGFTVTFKPVRTTQDAIREARVERQYDLLVPYGWNMADAAPWDDLYHRLARNDNFMGYDNPKMDSLIAKVRKTGNDEAKRKVLAEIQTLWAQTVPSVVLGGGPVFSAWDDNVHGAVPTVNDILLLDDAWVSGPQ